MIEFLALLILVSSWFGFYQFFRQQGRILLRIGRLEHHGQDAGAVVQKHNQEAWESGLPVGRHFPSFVLPDLANKATPLDGFRGRRVLLVNWNFECGFCDSIAPPLARLQTDLLKNKVQLVLLADGEARANQEAAAEHGLKCPILLMTEQEEGAPFDEEGTPVAYLVDAEGRVAKPVARGADRVLALSIELADRRPEPAMAAVSM